MDLTGKKPGWEKYDPIEGIELEIKRLSQEEALDLNAMLESREVTSKNGKAEIEIILPPSEAKECFKKYIRNIEGLKINGKKVKSPDKLFAEDMPNFPEIQVLYGMCIKRFFAINVMQEDETKNLNGPSELENG